MIFPALIFHWLESSQNKNSKEKWTYNKWTCIVGQYKQVLFSEILFVYTTSRASRIISFLMYPDIMQFQVTRFFWDISSNTLWAASMSPALVFWREVEAGLMEYKPDIIISVHPLMQHIPLWVLKWQGLQKKVIFVTVITDLTTCHRTWSVIFHFMWNFPFQLVNYTHQA